MYKLLACVLLLGGIAALGGIDAPRGMAQVKKDAKKDDKAGAGTIEIAQGKDGKFRFAVHNAQGKYIGGSGAVGFATEKDAVAAIDELKKVLATAKVTTKKGDAKDKAKDK